MEFTNLGNQKEKLIRDFTKAYGVSPSEVRIIATPYRISPLGAHIDHQGGPVLGMTIDAYTLMAYVPRAEGQIRLRSQNYPTTVEFDLKDIPASVAGDWGNYARGAAQALKEEFPLKNGITGILTGALPGGGLSSSASVILTYLSAFAETNDIRLKPWDWVRLTQKTENGYLGLKNGILDQTSIVFGRQNHLIHIDTREKKVNTIPSAYPGDHFRILIAYSGYSRSLMATGYNCRVQECRDAAAELSRFAGEPLASILSEVSERVFEDFGSRLLPHHHRRAHHYFTEVQRVQEGVAAWQKGDLTTFGRLMRESCKSSIEQYECGSSAIHELQQIVSSTPGVIGSRFSGGGFGGSVIGLAEPALAELAVQSIRDTYLQSHPDVKNIALFFIVQSADSSLS